MTDEHDHDHDHEHDHETLPDEEEGLTHFQVMEAAVRALLVEKGVLTPAEIRMAVEQMDARSPADGAKVVARAWVDPEFKARLLADGTAACRELGFELQPMRLVAVENTPEVHNLIVCTLCSCYPRMLLGLPPDWYKSRAYRSRAVREPRKILEEFGTEIAANVNVNVYDSIADMRYIVVPMRPAGTEHLDEEALAALVTRDSMIGVALARTP